MTLLTGAMPASSFAAPTTAAATVGVLTPDVVAWGRSDSGEIGDDRIGVRYAPVAVDRSGVLAGRTVTNISSGAGTTCAVADARAFCWGGGDIQQHGVLGSSLRESAAPVAVDTSGVLRGRAVTAVSVGSQTACAIADARVFCWGDGTYNQLGDGRGTTSDTPVAVSTDGVLRGRAVTAMSVGLVHGCAIADGNAYCWGSNRNGQLGDGSTTDRSTPVAVNRTGALAGKRVTAISVANEVTCVIADRRPYCWGNGDGGALGNGDRGSSTTPVAVDTTGVLAGRSVTAISTAGTTTCVIADGKPFCWGDNSTANLGNGTLDPASTPVAVNAAGALAGKRATQISVARTTVCATADQRAYCWGSDDEGQAGSATSPGRPAGPAPVDTDGALAGTSVSAVTTGGTVGFRSCAVASGAAYCWGTGAIGDGKATVVKSPVSIGGSGDLAGVSVTLVAAGPNHSCASAGSRLFCWGDILTHGEPSTTPREVDTSALRGRKFTALSAGDGFSCGLAGGVPYCWGSGDYGVLGAGGFASSPVPVPVVTSGALAGKSITALTSGKSHSCVIASGRVYCWGLHTNGQLGTATFYIDAERRTVGADVPVPVFWNGLARGTVATSVSAGHAHTCMVADGRAYCWGSNGSGQMGIDTFGNSFAPALVKNTGALQGRTVTAVATGRSHTCVLAAGQPFCFGAWETLGTNTAIGSQSSSSEPVAVARNGALRGTTLTTLQAGDGFTCGSGAGKIFCWGNSGSGVVPFPTGITITDIEPVAITGGSVAGRFITGMGVGDETVLALTSPTPPVTVPDVAPVFDNVPLGSYDVGVLSGDVYRIAGWAADRDAAAAPVNVDVYDFRQDGSVAAGVRVSTGEERVDVAFALPGVGLRQGYSASLRLIGPGTHRVCAFVINIGASAPNQLLGCRETVVGPIGAVDSVASTAPGVLTVSGWLANPATDLPDTVTMSVTGPSGTRKYTDIGTGLTRPDVAAVFPWAGGTTGFGAQVASAGAGDNRVCVHASTPDGADTLLGCRTVTVRNAYGSLDSVTVDGGSARLKGWALNPNRLFTATEIHVYASGPNGTTASGGHLATVHRPDVVAVFPGNYSASGFDISVPLTGPGSHSVCAFAITTGGGESNVLLGCRSVAVG